MRHFITAAAITLAMAASAQAATYRLGTLEVANPWSRPAAAGGNGAGFMVVTNRGDKPDVLKAVETPAARKAEIHLSSMTGGVMRMQRQDAGVTIPAGKSVTMAPGGYHLMLLGLTSQLKSGDKVPATLVFQSGARLKVEFQVAATAPGAPDPMAGHKHH
ncbi:MULTISPECIES: copper chaperone PCu(A)C [Phenylobacterium]|uniref:Copper(I)-binding protein n=1 Tax=Phenylobacterium koreense TaxID=266125 RepID=A0ABV2EGU2_9CAUL